MKRLRLGLLSTARINGAILAAAAATGCFDVAAVASRDATRAEAYAREHGIGRSYGAYDELLTDPDLDAVYISVPNRMHHEWTMRSLTAGKHVLCEKPYSRHAAEVEKAFACARERGLILTEGLMHRHHPQTMLVSSVVARGSIGSVRTIRATFAVQMRGPDDPRLQPDVDRGSLMEAGCYCVSWSRLIVGEPTQAYGEQVLDRAGVDVAFQGTLRFPHDQVAHLETSFLRPRSQHLEVVGDEGVIVVEAPFRPDWGGSVFLQRPGGADPVRLAVPEASAYELELANFADAIAGECEPLLGWDDAVGQARTIDALAAICRGRPSDRGLICGLRVRRSGRPGWGRRTGRPRFAPRHLRDDLVFEVPGQDQHVVGAILEQVARASGSAGASPAGTGPACAVSGRPCTARGPA